MISSRFKEANRFLFNIHLLASLNLLEMDSGFTKPVSTALLQRAGFVHRWRHENTSRDAMALRVPDRDGASMAVAARQCADGDHNSASGTDVEETRHEEGEGGTVSRGTRGLEEESRRSHGANSETLHSRAAKAVDGFTDGLSGAWIPVIV